MVVVGAGWDGDMTTIPWGSEHVGVMTLRRSSFRRREEAVRGDSAAVKPSMFVVVSVNPRLVAIAIAHPLIDENRRVANDGRIGGEPRLLIVGGSNMSGIRARCCARSGSTPSSRLRSRPSVPRACESGRCLSALRSD